MEKGVGERKGRKERERERKKNILLLIYVRGTQEHDKAIITV